MLGVPGDAMAAIEAKPCRQLGTAGGHSAPFPRGDGFHGMEAEDGHVAVGTAADGLPLIAGPQGMAGVLDEVNAILPAQGANLGEIAGLTRQMNGDKGPGLARAALDALQLLAQRRHAEVAGLGLHVDEVHLGAAVAGTVGGGDEANGRDPDPVVRAQFQRGAGEVQGRGAIAADDHMGSLAIIGQPLFEGGDRLALGEVVRLQDGDDGLDIFICDGLASIGDHSASTCWFMTFNSSIDRKSRLLRELYSKPGSTRVACSPRALIAKSLLRLVKVMLGAMT